MDMPHPSTPQGVRCCLHRGTGRADVVDENNGKRWSPLEPATHGNFRTDLTVDQVTVSLRLTTITNEQSPYGNPQSMAHPASQQLPHIEPTPVLAHARRRHPRGNLRRTIGQAPTLRTR
jgi:hypothetical protein